MNDPAHLPDLDAYGLRALLADVRLLVQQLKTTQAYHNKIGENYYHPDSPMGENIARIETARTLTESSDV